MNTIEFEVLAHVEPQGSKNAWVLPSEGSKGRAIMYDQNAKKLKPYRQEVARTAMVHVGLRPWAGKQVPVRLRLDFFFLKPASIKNRPYPSVAPDCDKCCRSTIDALSGILFSDDSQVVQLIATKNYGSVEMVRIKAEILT